MHRHIAVVTEGCGDRQAGASEPQRLSINTFTCLPSFLASSLSTVATVEVIAPDVAFERDGICGLRHGNFSVKQRP